MQTYPQKAQGLEVFNFRYVCGGGSFPKPLTEKQERECLEKSANVSDANVQTKTSLTSGISISSINYIKLFILLYHTLSYFEEKRFRNKYSLFYHIPNPKISSAIPQKILIK